MHFILDGLEKSVTSDESAPELAARRLNIPLSEIADLVILRESLDARKKNHVKRIYQVAVRLESGKAPKDLREYAAPSLDLQSGVFKPKHTPIIIGAGPAGLFVAYAMLSKGWKPVILEQGKAVKERAEDVAALWNSGILDPSSNVVFGEGGAGTFSDGKLTSRTLSPESDFFFKALIRFGANPAVAYQAKPHLGTDRLRVIIPAITDHMKSEGVEIHYSTRVEALEKRADGSVTVRAGGKEWVSDCVALATGHSSHEVYSCLEKAGVSMEKKDFAVGVRVEHPRSFIDQAQYGRENDFKATGAADYHLTGKTSDNRGVYSFCVCPGGSIINASSMQEHLAINGMSLSSRKGAFTNGAIVVSVRKEDLPSHPLAGLEFRRGIEKACGSKTLAAPLQSVKDFLAGKISKRLECSYKPGWTPANINTLLPAFIVKGLKEGFVDFERKIRGFIDKGVLAAPETGTSSPVRVVRNPETYESISCRGLYPVGEGAGYAGGIVSSAVDGIRMALKLKPV